MKLFIDTANLDETPKIYDNYRIRTEILAASLRHPLTTIGPEKSLADWKRTKDWAGNLRTSKPRREEDLAPRSHGGHGEDRINLRVLRASVVHSCHRRAITESPFDANPTRPAAETLLVR